MVSTRIKSVDAYKYLLGFLSCGRKTVVTGETSPILILGEQTIVIILQWRKWFGRTQLGWDQSFFFRHSDDVLDFSRYNHYSYSFDSTPKKWRKKRFFSLLYCFVLFIKPIYQLVLFSNAFDIVSEKISRV